MPIVLAVILTGCVTPPKQLYSWGSYEELIYTSYVKPGADDAQSQVNALEKESLESSASNLRLPPGWHAHLGYLYFQLGKTDQARQQFVTEKAQFPESAVFMDRLLTRLKKS